MWSRTRVPDVRTTAAALTVVLLFCAGYSAAAAAQSSTEPNSQQIILVPTTPPGPDSYAPNPPAPPPTPPSGGGTPVPPNPDPGDPPATSGDSGSPDEPGSGSNPDTGSHTVDKPDSGRVEENSRDNVPRVVQPAGNLQRQQEVRARIKAMETSTLDAARPSFSLLASPSSQGAAAVEPEFEPGEVLLSVNDIEHAKRIQQEIASEGYRVKSRRVFELLDMVVLVLRTPEGMPATDAISALSARFTDVVTDLNHRYVALGLSSSKFYAHNLIGLEQGQERCPTGEAIGMIDTAVNTTHPVFEGTAVEQLSVLVAGSTPAPAEHGTGVAALLVGNASEEFAPATSPGTSLVVIEAFRSGDRGELVTTAELVIAALEKLLSKQLRVINLSFGGSSNQLLQSAVRATVSKGVSVVAAAGRSASGAPLFPAGYDDVIAVTAVDAQRKLIKGAPVGAYIDIAAPGVDIWTATANGSGKFATGTSFAAPYVSAFVARLATTGENASKETILAAIQRTARDLGEPGHDHQFGWGLLSFEGSCRG